MNGNHTLATTVSASMTENLSWGDWKNWPGISDKAMKKLSKNTLETPRMFLGKILVEMLNHVQAVRFAQLDLRMSPETARVFLHPFFQHIKKTYDEEEKVFIFQNGGVANKKEVGRFSLSFNNINNSNGQDSDEDDEFAGNDGVEEDDEDDYSYYSEDDGFDDEEEKEVVEKVAPSSLSTQTALPAAPTAETAKTTLTANQKEDGNHPPLGQTTELPKKVIQTLPTATGTLVSSKKSVSTINDILSEVQAEAAKAPATYTTLAMEKTRVNGGGNSPSSSSAAAQSKFGPKQHMTPVKLNLVGNSDYIERAKGAKLFQQKFKVIGNMQVLFGRIACAAQPEIWHFPDLVYPNNNKRIFRHWKVMDFYFGKMLKSWEGVTENTEKFRPFVEIPETDQFYCFTGLKTNEEEDLYLCGKTTLKSGKKVRILDSNSRYVVTTWPDDLYPNISPPCVVDTEMEVFRRDILENWRKAAETTGIRIEGMPDPSDRHEILMQSLEDYFSNPSNLAVFKLETLAPSTGFYLPLHHTETFDAELHVATISYNPKTKYDDEGLADEEGKCDDEKSEYDEEEDEYDEEDYEYDDRQQWQQLFRVTKISSSFEDLQIIYLNIRQNGYANQPWLEELKEKLEEENENSRFNPRFRPRYTEKKW